ncbi:MAG: CesT family type III secretion system chaperone [Simkania sp.]|nr:CesT family type III secretion system chaperone [Simkania sp.]
MNFFEDLLKDLASLMDLPLHVDHRGVCCLRVDDQFEVQMEVGKKNDLIILAFINELGPGKFREEVLKEGLKANNQLLPGGIVSFSGKTNQLVIYKRLPNELLNAQSVLETLSSLIDYATQWLVSLKEGKTAPAFLVTRSASSGLPFGMKL